MPAEAFAVHGLSSEFLSSKPLFTEVVEEFLEFIGDAPLVIHNASFDISFINAELDRIKRQPISRDRLVDTLLLARRKHPGRVEPAGRSLLALCDRQFPPHQARRAARRRAIGRSLYRPDRGAAVATDPGVGNPRHDQPAELAKRRAGSARCRWRRESPTRTAKRIAPSSPRWATSRSGTIFCRQRPSGVWPLGCSNCGVSSALRRKRPAPQPAVPCSGGTGRRNRRDRASGAGSRRRGPRWR